MSFKHDNGRNTDLYKSLEKIAFQKGLIEETKLVKSASTKNKFVPGIFLDENVVNLCAGLREQGLVSQASDLEKSYLLYKIAKNSAPKDLDPEIMQMAHPAGSTRVSNVAAEAVVEDLLDVHLASLQVALREPTGQVKYASSKDVLKAVKIVLSEVLGYDQLRRKLAQNMKFLRQRIESINGIVQKDEWMNGANGLTDAFKFRSGSRWESFYNEAHTIFDNMSPTLNQLDDAKELVSKLKSILEPATIGGSQKNTWYLVKDRFDEFQTVIDSSIEIVGKMLDVKKEKSQEEFSAESDVDLPAEAPAPAAVPNNLVSDKNISLFLAESKRAIDTLAGWKDAVSSPKYYKYQAAADQWINSKNTLISSLQNKFEKLSQDLKVKQGKDYLDALRGYTWKQPNDFETFRKNLGLK